MSLILQIQISILLLSVTFTSGEIPSTSFLEELRIKSLLTPVGSVDKLNCTCGQLQKSPVGNLLPWTAFLALTTDPLTPLCHGSLISDKYILSAAHCTSKLSSAIPQLSVILPFYSKTLSFPISTIKNHPQASSLDNDVSLIKLRSSLNFMEFKNLTPICLPPEPPVSSSLLQELSNFPTSGSGESLQALLQGFQNFSQSCDFPWSKHSLRKKGMILTMSKKGRFELLKLTGLDSRECRELYPERVETQVFCAEVLENGKVLKEGEKAEAESCQAPSGTPILSSRKITEKCDSDFDPSIHGDKRGSKYKSMRFIQTGISSGQNAIKACLMSKGHKHFNTGDHPVLVFSSVAWYRDWIRDNTRDAKLCQNTPFFPLH